MVACRLTGRQTWQGRDGVWIYPLLEEAIAEAGLQELETFVSFHQTTLAQFIATNTIMDQCLATDWRPGPRLSNRWCKKDGVDMEGMQTASW